MTIVHSVTQTLFFGVFDRLIEFGTRKL